MTARLQRITLLSILFFLFLAFQIHGQEIVFDKVDSPNGSTYGFVTGITQDINGEMWFATKLGLFKYDGNQITPYVHDPLNDNTPQSNFIETVYADSNGDIWIGSLGGGLSRFDPKPGKFTHYRHDPTNPESISHDTITSILRDNYGDLWIGTHGGLDKFNVQENSFEHYRFISEDSLSLSSNMVRRIYEDKDGTLWVGTGSPYQGDGGGPDGGGLNRYNREDNNFTRFMHDPENDNSLLNNKICAIYQDDKGIVWIGTGSNGLHKLDKKTGKIERVVYNEKYPGKFGGPKIEGSELFHHITFIKQDITGNYWLGTIQHGIFYFDQEKKKMYNFSDSENTDSGFDDIAAWSCYISADGLVWFGTTNSGNIYRLNPIKNELPHFSAPAYVNNFYEDENNNLWIANDENLIIKNSKHEIQKEYSFTSLVANESESMVQVIKEDKMGKLWVGTQGGLFILDKNNDTFNKVDINRKETAKQGLDYVISIYEENDENFWIATVHGFKRLNREKNVYETFFVDKLDTINIARNIITSLLRDNNKLWVGTWNGNGIYLFNEVNNTVKHYLRGSSVVSFFRDNKNTLWAGTNGGLIRYNPESDKFIRYTDPGLISGLNNVFGIVEDNYNYLWISSQNGILRINPDRNESVKIEKNYGIDKYNLSWGAVYKSKNGNLFFGTETGYLVIDPTEFLNKKHEPIINIFNLRISNNLVEPGDGGPLKDELSKTKEIRLQSDQNVFSLDYNIIDYVNPDDNQLVYYLENYDKNWIQANSSRKAYYFNVPPGNYTFRVKGANSYGVWAEKKLDIIVLPPWYRTSWAYGFYALILIAGVFGFDRFQRRRILLLERKKAQKRDLEHAREIEKAYNELQATQTQLIISEKMASLGELTAGIAHEIQNPLNFVNNFSEINSELIEELEEEAANGNLDEVKSIAKDIKDNDHKIINHGKRAESIVKGMLLHSRGSSGEKELTDINALCDEYLRLSFHGFRAKEKSFNADFKLEIDENLPNIKVVPQDIGRVVLNLVNNAFYAVDKKAKSGIENYKPQIKVKTSMLNPSAGGRVQISISDNGLGIPDTIKEKIFQPFFTTKPTGQGTGLGLSLSYDIIKTHNGELKVQSEHGKGTEFTIILPNTDD